MNQSTFVALLRGINVGRNRKVLMADLISLHEELGHSEVKTYLQTGNVIFKTNQSVQLIDLTSQLEKEYARKFGFEIKVIVKTSEELSFLEKSNPVPIVNGMDDKFLHVVFLSGTPGPDRVEVFLADNYPETKVLIGDTLYIYYVDGAGKSKLTLSYIEKKLKVIGTARNLNTLRSLINICLKY